MVRTPLRAEQIFQRDRNAVQRAAILARGQLAVGLPRLLQRLFAR